MSYVIVVGRLDGDGLRSIPVVLSEHQKGRSGGKVGISARHWGYGDRDGRGRLEGQIQGIGGGSSLGNFNLRGREEKGACIVIDLGNGNLTHYGIVIAATGRMEEGGLAVGHILVLGCGDGDGLRSIPVGGGEGKAWRQSG